jgi:hypothetical protein
LEQLIHAEQSVVCDGTDEIKENMLYVTDVKSSTYVDQDGKGSWPAE